MFLLMLKKGCFWNSFGQIKTTSPKKYSVRPNTGLIQPESTCDFIGISMSFFVRDFIDCNVILPYLSREQLQLCQVF